MKKWLKAANIVLLMVLGSLFNSAADTSAIWYWRDGDIVSSRKPTNRANLQAIFDLAGPTRKLNVLQGPGDVAGDSCLWIHGNTAWYGAGMSITEIKRTRMSDSDPVNSGPVVAVAPYGLHSAADSLNIMKGIEIKGMTLNGNASAFQAITNSAPNQNVLYAPYVDGFRMESVRIKQSMRAGVFFQEARNVALYGCEWDSIGNWTVSATQNAIDFYNSNNRASSEGHGNGLIVDGFRITNVMHLVPAEAISLTNVSNVVITNGFVDGTDRVVEIQGGGNTPVDSNIVISNIVAKNLRQEAMSIGSSVAGRRVVNVSLTNSTFSGAPVQTYGRIITIMPNSNSAVDRITVSGCTFTNLNAGDTDDSPYFDIQPLGLPASTDIELSGNTIVGGNMAANNTGIKVRGNVRRVRIVGNKLLNIPSVAITCDPSTDQRTEEVVVSGNIVEWAGNDAIQMVVNNGSNGILRNVLLDGNIVIDPNRTQGVNGFKIAANSAAGGGEVSHVTLVNNSVERRSGTNPNNGYQLEDGAGGDTDSITIGLNRTIGVANKYSVVNTPTNISWLDPERAVSDLLFGAAVDGGNGATDPRIYSDKTLDLSTATSAQAAKNFDIVSRFTNTTAFTNLSLNGAHFINKYGASGSGGGDVATGIALGGYSEYRGNTTITGSLYGGELATSIYNNGTIANAFGSLNTAQITTGATATVTTLRGIQGLARVNGSGSGTVATAVAVEGVAGLQDTGGGTITDAIGGRFNCIKDGGATGTITNAYGITVGTVNQGGTNNYGIRVTGAAAGGSNINRSLSIDAGQVFFGDSIRVNKGFYAGGQFVNKILRGSATLDFDLTAVTCQDLTITVTGAAVGDEVFLGVPNGSIVADATFTAWVSAANTVTVRACDGALAGNPASGTYKVTVFQ